MAVVKKDSLTVVPASSITVVPKKKPQKILDEDTYTQVSFNTRYIHMVLVFSDSYQNHTTFTRNQIDTNIFIVTRFLPGF